MLRFRQGADLSTGRRLSRLRCSATSSEARAPVAASHLCRGHPDGPRTLAMAAPDAARARCDASHIRRGDQLTDRRRKGGHMTTYKRCSCRDENGRQLGTKCPRLRRADGSYADHGAWYFQLELDPESVLDASGKPVLDSKGKPRTRRRFVRRGSWERRKEAEAAQREA